MVKFNFAVISNITAAVIVEIFHNTIQNVSLSVASVLLFAMILKLLIIKKLRFIVYDSQGNVYKNG